MEESKVPETSKPLEPLTPYETLLICRDSFTDAVDDKKIVIYRYGPRHNPGDSIHILDPYYTERYAVRGVYNLDNLTRQEVSNVMIRLHEEYYSPHLFAHKETRHERLMRTSKWYRAFNYVNHVVEGISAVIVFLLVHSIEIVLIGFIVYVLWNFGPK